MVAAFRAVESELRVWPASRWAIALAGALVGALITGVPTGMIDTPLYHRMTAVTWWDYPIWVLSAGLLGLTLATYLPHPLERHLPVGREQGRRPLAASVLSFVAIGCPVCNKLVVALIGMSGALNYFAPVQPLLGLVGVALLGTGLAIRLRSPATCSLPAR